MRSILIKSALFILTTIGFQQLVAQDPLEFLHTSQIGGANDEKIIDLETDHNGDICVLIQTESDVLYLYDSIIGDDPSTFLLKFDQDGNLLFCSKLLVFGDVSFLDIHEMVILSNNDIVIPGGFRGSFQFGDTTLISIDAAKGFICKFNSDGTPNHIKTHAITNRYVIARHIAVNEDDEIYLSGGSLDTMYFDQNNDTIFAPLGGFKMPVFMYDSNFNLQWLKVFYADESLVGYHPIALDNEGNIAMAVLFYGSTIFLNQQEFHFQSDEHILFLKMTSNGELIWIKTAEGNFNTMDYDLCTDNDNNIYFVTGVHDTITYEDVVILEQIEGLAENIVLSIDENGNYRWHKSMHENVCASTFMPPSEIKVKDGYVYVAGEYGAFTVFGELYLQPVSSGFNSFLTKMDKENGNYEWAQGFYGTHSFYTNQVSFNFGEGNIIYMSAEFRGQGIYGNTSLLSYGNKDIYIAKVNDVSVGENEYMINETLSLFPNPGNDKFHVKTKLKKADLKLYNQTGNIVLEKQLQKMGTETVETSFLPNGIYFYRITGNDGSVETGKWIKQR